MMKWVAIVSAMLAFMNCNGGKDKDVDENEIPYWGDTVQLQLRSRVDGTVVVEYDKITFDSLCTYYRYSYGNSDNRDWSVYCEGFDSIRKLVNWTYSLPDVDLANHRSEAIEYYGVGWVNGQPLRSKVLETFGAHDQYFDDTVLSIYDSTRSIERPDNLNCNQALAHFRRWDVKVIDSLWSTNVKCLGYFDGACLGNALYPSILTPVCVIEFNGSYNDAATELERRDPLGFVTLTPWCEGVKDCGGIDPSML